ncbi:hypothetical protein [Kordia sp.]|uniref:hypothetical protein n=1 Tax=Kordia sp. TaxID=1965332 RepID=UPI003D28FEDE
MNNSSTFLLESKLKRLKISFSKENGKIIISNAKLDLTVLFGLVFLPLIVAVGIGMFFITSVANYSERIDIKILATLVFLVGIAIVNGLRIMSKLKANKNRKVLDDKGITIVENDQIQRFDATNVKDFEYMTKKLDNEIFEGKVFLIATNNQKHLVLGLDEESEHYLLDDLFWFIDYFKKHIEIETL